MINFEDRKHFCLLYKGENGKKILDIYYCWRINRELRLMFDRLFKEYDVDVIEDDLRLILDRRLDRLSKKYDLNVIEEDELRFILDRLLKKYDVIEYVFVDDIEYLPYINISDSAFKIGYIATNNKNQNILYLTTQRGVIKHTIKRGKPKAFFHQIYWNLEADLIKRGYSWLNEKEDKKPIYIGEIIEEIEFDAISRNCWY